MTFEPVSSEQQPEDFAPDANGPAETVTIGRAELEALRAIALAAEASAADRDQAPAPATESSLEPAWRARETALERELADREQKTAEWRNAFARVLRERELATALSGKPLVPGAATQLLKLWRDDFDVYEEGGEHKVASRDGRSVTQVVSERLSEREYAHFCQPPTRGGVDVRGGSRPSALRIAPPPRTLGESVISEWQAARPTSDPHAPIGLRRRR